MGGKQKILDARIVGGASGWLEGFSTILVSGPRILGRLAQRLVGPFG